MHMDVHIYTYYAYIHTYITHTNTHRSRGPVGAMTGRMDEDALIDPATRMLQQAQLERQVQTSA